MSESQVVTRYPSFKPSADALRLFHFLEDAEDGNVIKYSTLTAIIDRDIQKSGRNAMYTALNLMRREHGALFAVVQNVGIVRLRNGEKQGVLDQRVRRIHNQARRGRRDARTVNYVELSDAERTAYNVALSTLGALDHFSGTRTAKKLTERVTEAQKSVSVRDLVSLFAKVGRGTSPEN